MHVAVVFVEPFLVIVSMRWIRDVFTYSRQFLKAPPCKNTKPFIWRILGGRCLWIYGVNNFYPAADRELKYTPLCGMFDEEFVVVSHVILRLELWTSADVQIWKSDLGLFQTVLRNRMFFCNRSLEKTLLLHPRLACQPARSSKKYHVRTVVWCMLQLFLLSRFLWLSVWDGFAMCSRIPGSF